MRQSRTTASFVFITITLLLAATAPAFADEDAAEEAEPNWSTEIGLSYVGTSGNTDTSSLGLDFKSARRPTPWGLDLFATFTRAEDTGEVTAEQYLVGGRASRALNDRWSVFAGLSWARDTFGGFENRYIAEAGAEVVVLKTDKHTLSFDAGLTWTSEDQIRFDEELEKDVIKTVDWFGGVAGLKWDWAFSKNASLAQRVLYYPNFDESADWRLDSDTAVTANLTKLMALQFSYLVRYRNQPIDDREDTDTTTKMSVVFSF